MENDTVAKFADEINNYCLSCQDTNLPNCFHFFTSSHKLNKLLHSYIEFKVTLKKKHGMRNFSYSTLKYGLALFQCNLHSTCTYDQETFTVLKLVFNNITYLYRYSHADADVRIWNQGFQI